MPPLALPSKTRTAVVWTEFRWAKALPQGEVIEDYSVVALAPADDIDIREVRLINGRSVAFLVAGGHSGRKYFFRCRVELDDGSAPEIDGVMVVT